MTETMIERDPTELAKVKQCLRDIERLHNNLEQQALYGGNNGRLVAAAPIPGGDATVALGPWSYGRNDGVHDAPDYASAIIRAREYDADTIVNFHPLLTLETWAACWRDWFGHTVTMTATISRAAGYLRAHAHEMIEQTEREYDDGTLVWPPDFDEMVSELSRCRGTLENILYDGQREERSQVPCLDCGLRLVKRYRDHADDDYWLCQRCKRRYSDDEYALAKHQHLSSLGANRYVPIMDALDAIPRSRHIIRGWIARGQVRIMRCVGPSTVHVLWSDVREADRQHTLKTARRRRAS
jgi:ribosomal protein L37AE/L43A